MEQGEACKTILLNLNILKFDFHYIIILSRQFYLHLHHQGFKAIDLNPDLSLLDVFNITASKFFTNCKDRSFMPVMEWYAVDPYVKRDL